MLENLFIFTKALCWFELSLNVFVVFCLNPERKIQLPIAELICFIMTLPGHYEENFIRISTVETGSNNQMCLCKRAETTQKDPRPAPSLKAINTKAREVSFEVTQVTFSLKLLTMCQIQNYCCNVTQIILFILYSMRLVVSLGDLAVIIREKLMELSVVAVLERRDGPARFIVIKCVDSNMSPQFYVSIVL